MSYINIPKPGTDDPAPCVECGHKDCVELRAIAESLCSICGKPCGYECNITALNGHTHQVCAEVMCEIDSAFEQLSIQELRDKLAEIKDACSKEHSSLLSERIDMLTLYIDRRSALAMYIRERVVMHREETAIIDNHKGMVKLLKVELMTALTVLGRSWEDEEGGYARMTNPTKERVFFNKADVEKVLPALVIAIADLRSTVETIIELNLDAENEDDANQIKFLNTGLDNLVEVQNTLAKARSTKPPLAPTVQVK